MNELALFAGAGGGVLGSKLLGHRIVGYVEYEGYCQEVLKARMADGVLDRAPIFGDIKQFLHGGWADRYRGLVDVVSAGFPCQPHSVAGKQKGSDDHRDLWPETAEVIRRVRPDFALLENVPGIISSGYFREKVLPALSEMGFDAEWGVVGATDVGAPHLRKRVWVLAYRQRERLEGHSGNGEGGNEPGRELAEAGRPTRAIGLQGGVPDAERDALRIEREREREQRREPREAEPRDDGEDREVADADGRRREGERLKEHGVEQGTPGSQPDGRSEGRRRVGEVVEHPDGEGLQHGGEGDPRSWVEGEWSGDRRTARRAGWWSVDPGAGPQPGLGGVADGVPDRLDEAGASALGFVPRVGVGIPERKRRLMALGNAQVPLCAATAFRILMERAGR